MEVDTPKVEQPNTTSDENDHHGDSDSSVESGNDLDGIGNSATELININTKYQPEWGGAEAFREFYQNFKDGILRSFDMPERDFKPEVIESWREVLIHVYHPTKKEPPSGSRVLCGFIRFRYDAKSEGILEITNINAKLRRWHLGFGGTSKAKEKEQAGQHGEGMKLAALIMRRNPQNYTVKAQASKFSWNFGFNKKKLMVCTLTRINKDKISEWKAQERKRRKEGIVRKTEPNVWEDVSITIGEPRQCRTVAVEVKRSSKIPLNDFRLWLLTTTDIYPPKTIVSTSKGDILLDREFRNKIYLHGLLLSDGEKSDLKFQYGYNLLEGKSGRDRDTISLSKKENKRITEIWGDAIPREASDGKETALLEKYATLMGYNNRVADVFRADAYLGREAAELLYAQLRHNHSNALQPPFFHTTAETEFAWKIEMLNRKPVRIGSRLWSLFSKHGLCKPLKEIWKGMVDRMKSKAIDSTFATTVLRTFRASLLTLPFSVTIDCFIGDPEGIDFTVLYRPPVWKVNAKYLEIQTVQGGSSCPRTTQTARDLGELFMCDHIVGRLFSSAISHLVHKQPDFLSTTAQQQDCRQRAARKLELMPRAIRCYATGSPNEIVVSWTSIARLTDATENVVAFLHSTKCRYFEYLRSWIIVDTEQEMCNCRFGIATVEANEVVIGELDPTEEYVAMVSHADYGAFYGVPPPNVCPSDPNLPMRRIQADKTELRNTVLLDNVCNLFKKAIPSAEGEESHEITESKQDCVSTALCSKDLPWEQGFPAAYDWIQAKQNDSHVLIAKPKRQPETSDKKRAAEDDGSNPSAKKARLDETARYV